ncbi:hydroxysqualene dehydroxylase HpnE [Pseudonocardia kujensis]|uniref:hydroxysqualene dehydroxylase HpnE n=1 Tax=Pseudonocardia kujensis TaxID=1128675 RepID=UPI001E5CB9F4|nr:hydroxysqualene dehydroxylase HpnE [Pseudonocardia kujensis]MCE0767708.1 hydroxysqualene dehydroxylase HpnE [Pseudonocardia kujensis]
MSGGARVTVVGGGLAGVAAALRCADAGLAVTLLESRARLGGVAGSFTRGELAVDTGQHVFLRCCTAYRDFVVRIGAADMIVLQERLDIPVLAPGAAPARLRRTPLSLLPAPLHLGGALLRYRHLSVAERLRLVRAALALGAVDRTDPATDTRSFGDWLAEHGQGRRAVDALWDLVGIATLNARAGDASLALAATVFQLGLLTDAAAGDIGWATAPLGALHDDAARHALAAAGVEVRRSAKARALVQGGTRPGGRWRVPVGTTDGEEELVTDRIVCAVPPGPAERLLPPGALPLPGDWADRLGSTPIVNVHVVYDRRVLDPGIDTGFAAGVDTPVQWVFDRTAQSGATAVYGPRAQYLAVSLSAADDLVGLPAAALRERFLPALEALLPAARDAEVLDSFVTREPHATFRGAPGQAALRPGPRTALPGLYVAGAWTDTGWPATMEGAVRSGVAAADALLADRAAVPAEVAA